MRSWERIDGHDRTTIVAHQSVVIVAFILPQRSHDRTTIRPRSHHDWATIARRSWFLVIFRPPSNEDRHVQVSPCHPLASPIRWRSDHHDVSTRCSLNAEILKDRDRPMKPRPMKPRLNRDEDRTLLVPPRVTR